MSKALARRSRRSRALGRPRSARENPLSPIGTALIVLGGGALAGGLWGGLAGGAPMIVSGIQQGIDYAAIGGFVVGALSPENRDGGFAVAGLGVLTALGLSAGQTAYAALTAPKSS